MGDVTDDVIIARPFETDHRIFRVWHMSFGATYFIITCILLLTTLVIYVAHRLRRSRLRVGVRTIVFHNSSDVPHNTEECCFFLRSFVVGDQLASL